jgi:hypothetical protein
MENKSKMIHNNEAMLVALFKYLRFHIKINKLINIIYNYLIIHNEFLKGWC